MRNKILVFLVSLFFCSDAWASIALDGSTYSTTNSSNIGTIILTTTQSNDVIIVYANNETNSSINSISDTAGLTWTKRILLSSFYSNWQYEEWYAIAPSPLSSDTISLHWTTASSPDMVAFGISGANTSSPFDANASLPKSAATYQVTGISTSNANDMLIGGTVNFTSPPVPTGWTSISAEAGKGRVAYNVVSATQSSITVAFGSGGSSGTIVDAVQQASSSPASSIDTFFLGAP